MHPMRSRPDIRIGPVTLIVGDSMRVLRDVSDDGVLADLLVTDPPYRLTSGGRNSLAMSGKFAAEVYDNSGKLMRITPWADMPAPIFNACRTDCDAYVMADGKNIFAAERAFTAAGWKLHELIYWRKPSPTRSRFYMKNTEYIIYLWKGRARDITHGGTTQDLFFPRPADSIHNTQKPLGLLRKLITNSSDPGDLVLDPFSGSGSTLVAAMLDGRRALGVEACPEMAGRSAAWLQEAWDAVRRQQDAEGRSGPLVESGSPLRKMRAEA